MENLLVFVFRQGEEPEIAMRSRSMKKQSEGFRETANIF
jgi:hypothetical protein